MLGRLEVPVITGLVRVSADIGDSWDVSMLIPGQMGSKRGQQASSVVGSRSSAKTEPLLIVTALLRSGKSQGLVAINCLTTDDQRSTALFPGDLSNLKRNVPRYPQAF